MSFLAAVSCGTGLGNIEQRGTTGPVSFAAFKDGAEIAVVERKSKFSIQSSAPNTK